jgi:hypothetical protein
LRSTDTTQVTLPDGGFAENAAIRARKYESVCNEIGGKEEQNGVRAPAKIE